MGRTVAWLIALTVVLFSFMGLRSQQAQAAPIQMSDDIRQTSSDCGCGECFNCEEVMRE